MIFERKRLFPLENSIYDRNRIPGMIVTGKGTIIAYNEARKGVSDWSMMDVFALRSEDGGKTWSQPIVIATGSEKYNVVGNPVMVEDGKGVIHFIHHEQYAIGGGRLLHRTSEDDGVTWSEPEDITYASLPEYRNVFAVGPGHGILNAKGEIIFPVWFVPKYKNVPIEAHGPSVLSTLYSVDDGKNWNLGQIFEDGEGTPSPNEAEFALTSDGRVIVNARVVYQHRAIAYSGTGYNGWTPLEPRDDLPDAICFGSIISCEYEGKPVLVTANCVSTSSEKTKNCKRNEIRVRVSFDDGATWSEGKAINDGVPYENEYGGYVELAYDKGRGVVYVLFEADLGKTDYFVVLDVEYLLS